MALPSGAVFGCSLAISRLTRDSEISVMRMSGVSLMRIFLPIFVAGAMTTAVAYLFQEKVIVWAEKESAKVTQRIWLAPGPPPIQQNVFFRVDNYYFYVNSVHHEKGRMILGKVLIYEPPIGGGYPTLITADSASENDQVWTLRRGIIYRVSQAGEPELIGRFEQLRLNLHKAIADMVMGSALTPRSMSIAQLSEQIRTLGQTGVDNRSYALEYQFKLAVPLGSLILMLSVAPLGFVFGKGGGFTGALIGIVVFFFYWQAVIYCKVIGQAGAFNPVLAGWCPIVIFGLVGCLFLSRVERA
jgi:lipopolysaccharide export system permease protein